MRRGLWVLVSGLAAGCGGTPTEAPICYPHPVLGPPDMMSYTLGPNGTIELAFRCGQIIDRTTGSTGLPDFRIYGTFEPNSSAKRSIVGSCRRAGGRRLACRSIEAMSEIRNRDVVAGSSGHWRREACAGRKG